MDGDSAFVLCFVVDGEVRINQLHLQNASVPACSAFTVLAGNENVFTCGHRVTLPHVRERIGKAHS
jgi:hypothetical protein